MRILLICPSSLAMCPYVRYYINCLTDLADLHVVTWDRFHIDSAEENFHIFRDDIVGHKRGFIHYLRYSFYIRSLLNRIQFDKVVIFTLQLLFFIGRFVRSRYPGRFIVDIRDWHFFSGFPGIGGLINQSACTAVSSPGFAFWLPDSKKYYFVHNISAEKSIALAALYCPKPFSDFVRIGSIGSARDWEANKLLITSISNRDHFFLGFHGKGSIDAEIGSLLSSLQTCNISQFGFYDFKEESDLYIQYDMISVVSFSNSLNELTLLPNRLYNSLYFGKPLLCFEGSYLSEVVRQYRLGLCIDMDQDICDQIMRFRLNFDYLEFDEHRLLFLESAFRDNERYRIFLTDFAVE